MDANETGNAPTPSTSQTKSRLFVEFLGGAAVVVSLLFVYLEFSQSNAIASATINREIIEDINQMHDLTLAEPEVAELLVRMKDPQAEYSEVDKRRIRSVVTRWMNRWVAVHVAHRKGVLDDDIYEIYTLDMAQVVENFPAAKPYFAQFLDLYPMTREWRIFQPLASSL
jgi:predicted DNA-binding protein